MALNGYDESLFCTEDWDFWLRAFNYGFRFEHLEDFLYEYRFHGENLTALNKKKITEQAVDLRISNINSHSDTLSDVMKMRIYLLMAGDAMKIDDRQAAIKWYGKAVGISPDAERFTRSNLINYVKGIEER